MLPTVRAPRTVAWIAALISAGLAAGTAGEIAAPARAAIGQWLAFQRSVRTVEADFIQVRELRTLKNGLRSGGKVWIDRPGDRFRWQTGDAAEPKSVAVKNGDTLTLLQPGRKRAERRSLTESASARGGGAEAAFDIATGDLPDSYEGLTRQFTILEARLEGDQWRLRLAPTDSRLREALTEFVFLIDAGRHHLRGFEMTFRDGSTIRTTFTTQRFNGKLDDALFNPDLTGYDLR